GSTVNPTKPHSSERPWHLNTANEACNRWQSRLVTLTASIGLDECANPRSTAFTNPAPRSRTPFHRDPAARTCRVTYRHIRPATSTQPRTTDCSPTRLITTNNIPSNPKILIP